MRPILMRRGCLSPLATHADTTVGAPGMSPFDWLDREVGRMVGQMCDHETPKLAAYPVDVHEDEQHVHIDAEMPGFKKDEINVTFDDGVLTIEAERKAEKSDDPAKASKRKVHLSERRFTKVARSFRLPTDIDPTKVSANLADGVLHLTLDKAQAVKPRRIEVK